MVFWFSRKRSDTTYLPLTLAPVSGLLRETVSVWHDSTFVANHPPPGYGMTLLARGGGSGSTLISRVRSRSNVPGNFTRGGGPATPTHLVGVFGKKGGDEGIPTRLVPTDSNSVDRVGL
jgi:hypothetical protein